MFSAFLGRGTARGLRGSALKLTSRAFQARGRWRYISGQDAVSPGGIMVYTSYNKGHFMYSLWLTVLDGGSTIYGRLPA